ncbi:MAG: DUF5009 domain-containing protein [Planctomycetes bacterium]|nr:DUF5009 domain-containing protein [Planctomycetota bacterium]
MSEPRPARWIGLDALRGASIMAMILVNNPGSWGAKYQYAPLRHADWHGCTFTDLVFPTFLFCAGVAIVPAFQKKLDHGAPRGAMVAGIARRVLSLVLIGMFLSAFPLLASGNDGWSFAPLWRTRFPGVLQRIGVCYGIAALLYLFASLRTQRLVAALCLLVYWPLITLVPVPGVGAPDLGDAAKTLQGWLDQVVFGEHIWVKGKYDPEGLLSTMPALATCLLGVEAGRVLRRDAATGDKVATLLRLGAIGMALGAVWGWLLPINKYLWTSSYVLWTGGIAACGLGLAVWAFEQRGWTKWARPLQVYGTNALLVFVLSALVGRVVGKLWTVSVDGRDVPLKSWLFGGLEAAVGDLPLASLLFALGWVGGFYVLLAWLYRRGIVWKV